MIVPSGASGELEYYYYKDRRLHPGEIVEIDKLGMGYGGEVSLSTPQAGKLGLRFAFSTRGGGGSTESPQSYSDLPFAWHPKHSK